MKFINMYLVGYVVLILGVTLALWQVGVLQALAPVWIAIGLDRGHRAGHHVVGLSRQAAHDDNSILRSSHGELYMGVRQPDTHPLSVRRSTMPATRNAIFEEGQRHRRKRDAPPQARHAAIQFRRQGHQPQAGNRDRAERGARQRRPCTEKAVLAEEVADLRLSSHHHEPAPVERLAGDRRETGLLQLS